MTSYRKLEFSSVSIIRKSQPRILVELFHRGIGHRKYYCRHGKALNLYHSRPRLISIVHTGKLAKILLTACCKFRRQMTIDAILAMVKISVDPQISQLVGIAHMIKRKV